MPQAHLTKSRRVPRIRRPVLFREVPLQGHGQVLQSLINDSPRGQRSSIDCCAGSSTTWGLGQPMRLIAVSLPSSARAQRVYPFVLKVGLVCMLLVTMAFGNANIEMGYSLQSGSLEGVKKALELGADINKKGSGQQTPLMAAILGGHTEIVKLLLSKNADATLGEQQGYTPMHGAGFQGRADIVPLLQKYGLDPSERHEDGHTPIHRACWGDEPRHAATVTAFLEAGVSPNLPSSDGTTPLQHATKTGNKDTIRVLRAALAEKDEV